MMLFAPSSPRNATRFNLNATYMRQPPFNSRSEFKANLS
nr:MAG TPA: hypothetical protein [Caudoviricetes sp.]